MKFHDELNPIIWDKDNDNQMRPEVLAKLKEIANAFIEYIEIPEDAVLDIVVTGSSASYNYNKFSDLDLHIIVDYDKIHEDCPLVEGYLGALKNTFNKEHDIFIKDVPVELYAEKKDQGTVHNGLYSVQQEEWIDRPEKIAPTDNDAAVEAKFNEIKEMVDKCDDSEQAQELLEKIYNMRKAGLAEAGEFCTENLAFKKLRNEGCMDKLRQLKKEQIDKQLSLESYNESEELNNNNLSNLFNSIWDEYEQALINWVQAHEKCLDSMKKYNIDERKLRWLIGDVKGLHLLGKLSGDEDWDNELLGYTIEDQNESIKEDFEDDCKDCPEEMHKERYVTYFETQEGRQKYTIYHVYTDSTDDSYNELCDKRDNQLGMYSSYQELKDALKERAEKIAKQQGWTVKSIENLGEDDTYYRERNKFESMDENIVDAIGSVELPIKDKFIDYVDLYPIDKDLIDVQFVAKNQDGNTMPIYVANGTIDKDGEWNTLPEIKWNVSHLNDRETANYIMDEFSKFINERDYKLEELRKAIQEKIKELDMEKEEVVTEDLATLEKKVDKAESDIQDIIKSYTTNESIFDKLDETFKKALDEEVEIDSHNFTFKVTDTNIQLKSDWYETIIDIDGELDQTQLKSDIEDTLDFESTDFFEGEGEITGTELVGFKYNPETKEGEFEFNIFFE